MELIPAGLKMNRSANPASHHMTNTSTPESHRAVWVKSVMESSAVLRLNDFFDLPVFQQAHAIGKHIHRQVVRGDQYCGSFPIDDLAEEFHDLLPRRGV